MRWVEQQLKNRLYWLIAIGAVAGPVLGFFGKWNWLLDLFSHFQVQYAVILLIASFFFLARRQFVKLAFVLPVFLVCLNSLAPYFPATFISKVAIATPLSSPISILHANVYTPNQNYGKLAAEIRKADPDVVVLLEVSKDWHRGLEEVLEIYPSRVTELREDHFGLAVFSKLDVKSIEQDNLGGYGGPSFRSVIEHDGREFVLWATHPRPPITPQMWRQRNAQFEVLGQKIRAEKRPTILVGDLNSSPWSYWFGVAHGNQLKDSARNLGIQLTWPAVVWHLARIPIDHILHTPNITVLERRVLADIGSDHLPVYAELEIA